MIAVALQENEVRRMEGRPCVYTVSLTCEAIEECRFWLERMSTHNGFGINCREAQVQVLLWSDASDVGWGGEAAGVVAQVKAADVELPDGPVSGMAYGALARADISRSSTRRELMALMLVANSPNILEQIRGKRIRVIMDSVPALRNLIKGGGPVK